MIQGELLEVCECESFLFFFNSKLVTEECASINLEGRLFRSLADSREWLSYGKCSKYSNIGESHVLSS